MSLHDPARHVSVEHGPWDPARAEAWLRRWAADAVAARAQGPWPMHPRDVEDASEPLRPLHSLYIGAAGVWLALIRLARAGHVALPGEPAEIFEGVLADYARSPDTGAIIPSWFIGESGLLTVRCVARHDAAHADRLAAIIAANHDHPTREMLFGGPGMMHAALHMHAATGEERWAALFRAGADALWASWSLDERIGVHLWEQDFAGRRVRYLGAGHGWAGNLHPLWRGAHLLGAERRAELRARTLAGLERLPEVDGELANLPPESTPASKRLVQWCHGAPGLVTSLRDAALPEALPLLLRCARLIVAAGPLSKGVALCHGTDGNGMALLEIHRRTQDDAWLGRAREFAMAALEQSEALAREHGQWRWSLWTGDAGLAWFLLDCLAGRSDGMPGLDTLI